MNYSFTDLHHNANTDTAGNGNLHITDLQLNANITRMRMEIPFIVVF